METDRLYKESYATSKRKLMGLGCSFARFEDYYQESFLIYWEKIKVEEEVIFNPEHYIIRVCKNLWIKDRKRIIPSELTEDIDSEVIYETLKIDIKYYLFIKHFKLLPVSCIEFLSLYLQGFPIKVITSRLNLPNDKATIDRKYYCKKKLKEMIHSDPLFTEVAKYESEISG